MAFLILIGTMSQTIPVYDKTRYYLFIVFMFRKGRKGRGLSSSKGMADFSNFPL